MAEPFGNNSTAATASGTSVLAAPAGGFNPLAHAAMHASVGSGMDEDEDDEQQDRRETKNEPVKVDSDDDDEDMGSMEKGKVGNIKDDKR